MKSKLTNYLLALTLCFSFCVLWGCKDDDDDPTTLPTLTLPASIVLSYEAVDTTITIEASSGTWTVDSPQKWLKFTPNTERNSLRIQVEENTGTISRAAQVNVVIEGVNVAGAVPVVQDAKPSLVITPSASLSVLAAEGETTLTVSLSSGDWTAAVSAGSRWLSVEKSSSQALKVKYMEYTGSSTRTGTIRVSVDDLSSVSQDITVTQSVPTSIVLSGGEVRNNTVEVSQASGTLTVNVQLTGLSDVEWSAAVSGSSSWVTSVTPNTTAGTLEIQYQENNERLSRTAMIDVTATPEAGNVTQSLFLTQTGDITATTLPTLDFSSSAAESTELRMPVLSSQHTLEFPVNPVSTDPSFSVLPLGQVSKGTLSGGRLPITIEANNLANARTLVVTLSQSSKTVRLILLQEPGVVITVTGAVNDVITLGQAQQTDQDFAVTLSGASASGFSVSENIVWLTATQNSSNLRLSTTDANSDRAYRSGTVTITINGINKELIVEQQGLTTATLPSLDFTSTNTLKVDIPSSSQVLSFSSTVDPSSFTSDPTGIARKGTHDGTGNILPVSVSANGSVPRTITVEMGDGSHSVTLLLVQAPIVSIRVSGENVSEGTIMLEQGVVTDQDFVIELTGATTWRIASQEGASWLTPQNNSGNLRISATENMDRFYRLGSVTLQSGDVLQKISVEQKGDLSSTNPLPRLDFSSHGTIKMDIDSEIQTLNFPSSTNPEFSATPPGAAVKGSFDGSTLPIEISKNGATPRSIEITLLENNNIIQVILQQNPTISITLANVSDDDVVTLEQTNGATTLAVTVEGTDEEWTVNAVNASGWLTTAKSGDNVVLTTNSANANREYLRDATITITVGEISKTFTVEQKGLKTATDLPELDFSNDATVKMDATSEEQTFTFNVTHDPTGGLTVNPPGAATEGSYTGGASPNFEITLAKNPNSELRTITIDLVANSNTITLIIVQDPSVVIGITGAEEDVIVLPQAMGTQNFAVTVMGSSSDWNVKLNSVTGGSWLTATKSSGMLQLATTSNNTNREYRLEGGFVLTVGSTEKTFSVEQRGDMAQTVAALTFSGTNGARSRVKISAPSNAVSFTLDGFTASGYQSGSSRVVDPFSAGSQTSTSLPLTLAANPLDQTRTVDALLTNNNSGTISSVLFVVEQAGAVLINIEGAVEGVIEIGSEELINEDFDVILSGPGAATATFTVSDSPEAFLTATKEGTSQVRLNASENIYLESSFATFEVEVTSSGSVVATKEFIVKQRGNFHGVSPRLDFTISNPDPIHIESVSGAHVVPFTTSHDLDRFSSNPVNAATIVDMARNIDGQVLVQLSPNNSGNTRTIEIEMEGNSNVYTINIAQPIEASVNVVGLTGNLITLDHIESYNKQYKVEVEDVTDATWTIEDKVGNWFTAQKVGDNTLRVSSSTANAARAYRTGSIAITVNGSFQTLLDIEQKGDPRGDLPDVTFTEGTSNIIKIDIPVGIQQDLVFASQIDAPVVYSSPVEEVSRKSYASQELTLSLSENPDRVLRTVTAKLVYPGGIVTLIMIQAPLIDIEGARDDFVYDQDENLVAYGTIVLSQTRGTQSFKVATGSDEIWSIDRIEVLPVNPIETKWYLSAEKSGNNLVFTKPENTEREYRVRWVIVLKIGDNEIPYFVEQTGDITAQPSTLNAGEYVLIDVPGGTTEIAFGLVGGGAGFEDEGVPIDGGLPGEDVLPIPLSNELLYPTILLDGEPIHANTIGLTSFILSDAGNQFLGVTFDENLSYLTRDIILVYGQDVQPIANTVIEIRQLPGGLTITNSAGVVENNEITIPRDAFTNYNLDVEVRGVVSDWSYEIEGSASWLSATKQTNRLVLSGSANTSRAYNSEYLIIRAAGMTKKILVLQEGDPSAAPPALDLSMESTIRIAMPNGDATDLVFAGVTADPTVVSNHLEMTKKAWVDPNLTIAVAQNNTGHTRTGTLEITGTGAGAMETITLHIIQPYIMIKVGPTAANVIKVGPTAATAGQADFAVTVTGSAETWSLGGNPAGASWITSAVKSGNNVRFVYNVNNSILYRSQAFTIHVGGSMKTFTLEQAGDPTATKSIPMAAYTSNLTITIAVPSNATDVTIAFTSGLTGDKVPALNTEISSSAVTTRTAYNRSNGNLVLNVSAGNGRMLQAYIEETKTDAAAHYRPLAIIRIVQAP